MGLNVAFIGLGVMGFPIARHLAKAGHTVAVYNRSHEKTRRWTSLYGGRGATSAAEVVQGCDLVFACVGNDDDLHEVTMGRQGAFQLMKRGSIFVDHTTTSATVARDVAAAARALGLHTLDAPVSGGQAGAEDGTLTVMVGGEAKVFDKVRPVIDAYAREVRLLGPSGAGQLAKMVNQICIAGILQGLSEALRFAEVAGLDGEAVLEVISKGAAQSWQMENRGKTMLAGAFDFGFAVDWMRKDLGIVQEEARRLKVGLPLAALVDQCYADVQRLGGGRWDTSSLITRLRAFDRGHAHR